jgi:hypothetical protein
MSTQELKRGQTLQAYVDKRNRLWVQVKTDYPSYTQAQVEARLELFGV